MATESTPTFRRLKQLMSTARASAETEMTARFMGGGVILQRSIRGRMRADDSPRTSLPADPGPDQHTRSHPARDGGADDRSPRPGVRRARPRGARRTEDGVSDRSRRSSSIRRPGSGAWEASLVNTLSPGDAVLAFDIGEFSKNWADVARRLGLDVELMPGTWRRGVDPDEVGERLARDRDHRQSRRCSSSITKRRPA